MKDVIVIRGGGDIASGVIQKFHRSGFKVIVLEIEKPSFIRRKICYGEAVYEGEMFLEGSKAILAQNIFEAEEIIKNNQIAILIDQAGNIIKKLKPLAVIDAILAKKNLGTNTGMAPITIGLGPGFEAGKDVNIAIETMRGHDLGRLIFKGKTQENTGIPGIIEGYGKERVIYSKVSGVIKNTKKIGDLIKKNEVLGYIGEIEIKSPLTGIIRGLIRDGYRVPKGFKIGDVDPRLEEKKNCFTISDKARNIGGSALEAFFYLRRRLDEKTNNINNNTSNNRM